MPPANDPMVSTVVTEDDVTCELACDAAKKKALEQLKQKCKPRVLQDVRLHKLSCKHYDYTVDCTVRGYARCAKIWLLSSDTSMAWRRLKIKMSSNRCHF